jgi:hypothetical protein
MTEELNKDLVKRAVQTLKPQHKFICSCGASACPRFERIITVMSKFAQEERNKGLSDGRKRAEILVEALKNDNEFIKNYAEEKADSIHNSLLMATNESCDTSAWANQAREEVEELLKSLRGGGMFDGQPTKENRP